MMKTVTLFGHQSRGIDRGIPVLVNRRGLGIFFDPGLGKSLTALTIAHQLMGEGEIGHLLIVCPKTLFGTWQDQIHTHTDWPVAFEYHSTKLNTQKYRDIAKMAHHSKVILTNYEAYRNPTDELAAILKKLEKNTLVVLDESTRIKTPGSQQTKGTKSLLNNFWGRVIMTGTEITKSPLDLYSQFEFLRTGVWGEKSFFSFKHRYAITEPLYLPGGKQTTKIVGFQRINKLQEIVEPWIIRAKKEQCVDLPPKIFQNIPVELTAKEWKAYQELKKRMITILESGELISVDQKIALFTRFRTITGGWADTHNPVAEEVPSKLAVLCDMIEDDDSQAIIWASFDHEITMILKELKNYGQCVTYVGSNSQEERQTNFEQFCSGQARFFIANPKTAGFGLNLQHCGLQYFYSLPTSAEEFMQSLDRSHRIGTKAEVVYRFLLGVRDGTQSIDWRVKTLLDQSVDLLHAFQTRSVKELVALV